MKRIFSMKQMLLTALLCAALAGPAAAQVQSPNAPKPEPNIDQPWGKEPMIGMYVHQHWSYNHPYAARTWTLDDWQGYLGGLKKLGYNTVLIWPVLETIPNPMTPSDVENLEKIKQVIEHAHNELDMRVLITLCPNVIAKNEEATKYTFVERPFFYTDLRINPADAVEMGKMMEFREEIFGYLKAADGVLIIDSDPGGYPGSNNLEFVSLLNMHRTMFDKLNPELELYYWIHAGWEAYCRFYATAEFALGEMPEIHDAIKLLNKADPEPWGLASGRGPNVADELGLSDKVMSYQYGGIEGEPSFPMTNWNTERAYVVGAEKGARGTMGNAQTHCVQLPNTFLFSRGAQDLPKPEIADYVAFAERLLPGHGEAIVQAWQALDTIDGPAMRAAADKLEPLRNAELETGDLEGLLFGDPQRFVGDLLKMLDMRAKFEEFHAAALGDAPKSEQGVKLKAFVDAAAAWQQTHDYKNNWYWPRLEEALVKVDQEAFASFFAERSYKGEGDTPFEQVQNAYKQVETYTPRLIEAMQDKAKELQG